MLKQNNTLSVALALLASWITPTVGITSVVSASEPSLTQVQVTSAPSSRPITAMSPDRQTIVRGNPDGTIQILDATETPIGQSPEKHQGAVTALAFSPDGQTITSGGQDGVVRVWRLDGSLIGQPFAGHNGAITTLVFSPDGQTITSSSTNGTLVSNLSGTNAPSSTVSNQQGFPVWWWLLPLALLAILLWFLLKRRGNVPTSAADPAVPPPPPATPPELPTTTTGLERPPVPPITGPTPSEPPDRELNAESSVPPRVDRAPVMADPTPPPTQATDRDRPIPTSPPSQPPSQPLEKATPSAGVEAVLEGVAAVTAAAGAAAWSLTTGDRDQSDVEATKYNVGQTEDPDAATLASVDEGLADLPDGYGESRIVLMPRDPQWAYAYWDVPREHKETLRQQGGTQLALRFYDVTDVDINHQNPHSLQQYPCDELARDWHIPIPVSDRDYIAELGYVTGSGGWLLLARSAPVRVPPVYPSDWYEEHFHTVSWDDDLQGKTLLELIPPSKRTAPTGESAIYGQIFDMAQSQEIQRVAGSLFGSMQQVPQQALSSYVFPSGIGGWAVPTVSGLTMSGVGMSGIGFSASMPPMRPRKFWLVADAELIVYGATEPDATVTIDGRPIRLNPDGTFQFHVSFQDGVLRYPIVAIAADGEQTRSIRMNFERETPARHTNTKDEAIDEWPS